eukprot:364702-Chlamydomonas_euryale.AAC.3
MPGTPSTVSDRLSGRISLTANASHAQLHQWAQGVGARCGRKVWAQQQDRCWMLEEQDMGADAVEERGVGCRGGRSSQVTGGQLPAGVMQPARDTSKFHAGSSAREGGRGTETGRAGGTRTAATDCFVSARLLSGTCRGCDC